MHSASVMNAASMSGRGLTLGLGKGNLNTISAWRGAWWLMWGNQDGLFGPRVPQR